MTQHKHLEIPLRETLHFLGWRGSALDPEWIGRIRSIQQTALSVCAPRVIMKRFAIKADGTFANAAFRAMGNDVTEMLSSCSEGVLMAATLGAEAERQLLRTQAKDAGEALILDAALSAAIEAVCDQAEAQLREELAARGLYLTDRFSPGYGDMPMHQTREICDVLDTARAIGLTVSQSGVMMPRKSVCAIMGISTIPVARRPSGCEGCAAQHCALRRTADSAAE